ncbi:MAG: AsmA-like C-terminal region-containing protein, partial [Verrucomicrobiota bacterium]
LKQGSLLWPVAKTNDLSFAFSNITARIEFPNPQTLVLAQLEGDSIGAHIKLGGVITNFTGLRALKFFRPKKDHAGKEDLSQIASALRQIRLTGDPQLALTLNGDASEPRSLRGSVKFSTRRAQTPWGNAKNLQLTSELRDLWNKAPNTFVRVKADSLEKTPWGSASNVNCYVKLASSPLRNEIFQTDVRLSAKKIRTELGQAGSFQFSGQTSQSSSNLIPSRIRGKANVVFAETKWGKAGLAEMTFIAATNTASHHADESWAAWRYAEPFLLNWVSRLSKVETPSGKMEKIFSAGAWTSPTLVISNLDAQLSAGGIKTTGQLNVVTREATARISSELDAKTISQLLSPDAQRWLEKFSLEKPAQIRGDLQATLPAWTNRAPDWRAEVLPTLALRGHVAAGRGSYREISFNSAQTDLTYSNRVWILPNLQIDRADGNLDLSLVTSDLTRDFRWRVHSEMDPSAVRPLLTEPQQRVLDDFQFTTAPSIHAELLGHWDDVEKVSVAGEIAAADFSYRSNKIEKLTSAVAFTNQQLRVSALRLESGGKLVTAETVALDFPTKRIFFTNVFSTVDPYLVTRLIGEKVAASVAPYEFAEPPEVHLNGALTLGQIEDADLHFDVSGNRFKWTQFIADRISGRVDWQGMTLLLTNMQADIYRGRAVGWSYFEFTPHNGADFRFDLAVADIDLASAVQSLTGKTNHLEGLLHGHWALESGNTHDAKSLRGPGTVNVRDGLLWDVPVFGIFSPMLNAILPGAGNSRAHEASAKFLVSNGMIYSDDLEIRSPAMRMQYRGGVDFQQNIDARVEAELLRDTWIIGRLVSLALTPLSKLFEYKVTGTLSHPESEPVYIPNFLMMTLRPFHSIKKALTQEKAAPSTNGPAATEKP